jgi:hypothetical protein
MGSNLATIVEMKMTWLERDKVREGRGEISDGDEVGRELLQAQPRQNLAISTFQGHEHWLSEAPHSYRSWLHWV